MARVFISYRRRDNPYVAGILRDALQDRFGTDEVFYDLDNIPFGVDFRRYIADAVGSCDVLLVVIGEQWLHLQDEKGRRRLDDPADFVRIEIETALSRQIPVVPVLVEDAQMPAATDLPESIRELAFRNAAEIRAVRDQKHQVERLISGLTANLKPDIPAREPEPVKSKEAVPVAPPSHKETSLPMQASPKRQIMASGIVLALSLLVFLVTVMLVLTSNGRISWDEGGPVVLLSLVVAIASAVFLVIALQKRA